MRYLIEINLYTAVMLLVYMLLLRNRTVFHFSRLYLLASAILPLVFPLIRLPNTIADRVQSISVLQFTLPEVVVGGSAANQPGLSVVAIAAMVYIGVALAILGLFGWNLYRMWKIVRSSDGQSKGDFVLLSNSGYGPGSFGRYIFFPDAEINEAILEHEKAHIQLNHTRDLVFLNLLQAFAWPSFLLRLVKKELKEVHEFQADAIANRDKHSYAQLLLSATLHVNALPEMHLFIIHPLKRRIRMLQKDSKSSPFILSLLVLVITITVSTSVLFIQSCNKSETKQPSKDFHIDKLDAKEISKEEYDKEVKRLNKGRITKGDTMMMGEYKWAVDEDMKPETLQEPAVYDLVDEMPQPTVDLSQFLASNIHYPSRAKDKHIEGRVTVRFVVDREGYVTYPQIIRSPDTSLSVETLRVINSMPKWKPGKQNGKPVRVNFTLPVLFRLQ